MLSEEEREEIRQLLREQTEYHRANPAAAREFLLSTGIYTADGELAPQYRSDYSEEDDQQPQPQPPR